MSLEVTIVSTEKLAVKIDGLLEDRKLVAVVPLILEPCKDSTGYRVSEYKILHRKKS